MNSQNTICCPQRIEQKKNNWWVFLAGPIQGAPEWQHNMPNIKDIIWLSPRRLSYDNFDYEEQVSWETDYMQSSDIILMWIPEEIEHIEGRQYAQTTRTEFGEYIARGKKIIFGCYEGFPGEKYFLSKLKQYGLQDQIYHSLDECIIELESYINKCDNEYKLFFTSDTHFGSERTLELSKRPYKNVNDMDKDMIIKWNNKVHPHDVVYHLGDFGEIEVVKYLNGNIQFVKGNYERDGKSKVPPYVDVIGEKGVILDNKYILVHEPLQGLKYRKAGETELPILFGHIHGRQKVKEFVGVDVGVDCNNYEPMSQEEVDFFINAIQKNYYDEEVWS